MVRDIRDLYNTYWRQESIRLKEDAYHSIEFSTTLMFLSKYLPKGGLILDAGGGTGVYTMELAKKGHDVVLLDLSKENIDEAKKEIAKLKEKRRVKDTIVGDITDLSRFKDSTFDAVLCLGGPISLVYGKSNRRKAMSELVRVAKPGAPIFISVMNRYGYALLAPRGWPKEIATTNFVNALTKG